MSTDMHDVTVSLSGSDAVFLMAYAQRHRGEQADIEISSHTRSPQDRKADLSAGIHDALELLRRVSEWQRERGDDDAWFEHREARMRAEAQG